MAGKFGTNATRSGTAAAGSLTDQAQHALRERILTCDIPPGAFITEGGIATELAVGKTPVREALARLAAEGLVRPMARRGYQVTPLTMGGVLEIFDAWLTFAPDVAALIARRASEEEKTYFFSVNERWASDNPDDVHPEELPPAVLIELTNNPFIVEMTRAVTSHFARLLNFALRQGAFTDTDYIARRDVVLDAMARGDGDGAREAVQTVVAAMRTSVIDALLRSPAVLDAQLTMDPAVDRPG